MAKTASFDSILERFRMILDQHRNNVAAFLSEPVWTNAGAVIPPADFYPAIEKICRERGIIFIMDEIATGFGRCGTLFASELWNLQPDILCLGKALTGGYGTLGATLVTEDIFEKSKNIPSYSTFGWLPMDLAAARANVAIILRDKLWEQAKIVGEHLLEKLKPLQDLPFVAEVRGIGLLLGIEIIRDKKIPEPHAQRATYLQDMCAEKGLLIETADNTLFITPPLILTLDLADMGAEILSSVLQAQPHDATLHSGRHA